MQHRLRLPQRAERHGVKSVFVLKRLPPVPLGKTQADARRGPLDLRLEVGRNLQSLNLAVKFH